MVGGTSSLSTNQRGALLAGAMAAVLSFVPGYIEVTFDGKGFDESYTAWSGSSTIGMMLLLGSTALIGIEALSRGSLPEVVPWHLIAVLAAVLGTLLIILRAFTAGSSAPGANVGPGWPGLLLFVAALALTVFAVLSFFDSEDALEFGG
jgi:hypothetical protein